MIFFLSLGDDGIEELGAERCSTRAVPVRQLYGNRWPFKKSLSTRAAQLRHLERTGSVQIGKTGEMLMACRKTFEEECHGVEHPNLVDAASLCVCVFILAGGRYFERAVAKINTHTHTFRIAVTTKLPREEGGGGNRQWQNVRQSKGERL